MKKTKPRQESQRKRGAISTFIAHHYRHFNAAALIDAAKGYEAHLRQGGKMLVTLAGAMRTAELGLSLAEMIRRDKVHAIVCTGANLEEDIFNLVAHDSLRARAALPRPHAARRAGAARAPHEPRHRHLHPRDGGDAPHREGGARGVGRRPTARASATSRTSSCTRCSASGKLKKSLPDRSRSTRGCSPPREKNLPMWVPGWEDSTLGNMYAGHVHQRRREERPHRAHRHRVHDDAGRVVHRDREAARPRKKNGIGASASSRSAAASPATSRSAWCRCCTRTCSARACRSWGYFCQISDSTTSYGSYSGAVPNEKITWGKLGVDTPKFIIESDATIVAPLIFAWLLDQ